MHEHSYVDRVKAESRERLWRHAIHTLTIGRSAARLLRGDRFVDGWSFCEARLRDFGSGELLPREELNDWLDFADRRYGQRAASDLRIAYLAGPEPENDMDVLANHGVRIENVWAIEADERAHNAALERARSTFPQLKIYHGTFESFCRVFRERFDIIYLDFTAPLLSPESRPYATIHAVFEEQALADFGVLVVNVAEPAANAETVDLLAAYFAQQPYIESGALGYSDDEERSKVWYAETAPDQWQSAQGLRDAIGASSYEFYSALCTQYPSLYANRAQPALRLLRVSEARRGLFAKDTRVYNVASGAATDADAVLAMFGDHELPQRGDGFGPGMDVLMSPSDFPLWWFHEGLRGLKDTSNAARKWLAEYDSKLSPLDSHPFRPSRVEGIRLGDLLWHIAEGYYPLASESLLTSMVGALREFTGRKAGLFCDTPMLHLISQLALNQLGFAYHPVQDQHWRATYKSKRTQMFLDAHVFDQCRPLYDRLPAIALYPEHFRRPGQEFITRIGMSLIEAQARGLAPRLYWASSLAERYGPEWEKWSPLQRRIDLNAIVNLR